MIRECVLSSSVPDKRLGDTNDEREFIVILKNMPADASLRI
jgi:hypothetical protein